MNRKNRIILLLMLIVVVLLVVYLLIKPLQRKSEEPIGDSRKESKEGDVFNEDVSGLVAEKDFLHSYRCIVHSPFGFAFDNDTVDDFVLERRQYVLSYCGQKNVANWVAWQLNPSWLGSESRFGGNFITDTSLPDHFYRVTHQTYTNSGFDRGHIVRSKERTLNAEDNRTTFLLTNILPKTPDLNRGVWLRFEDYYLSKVENQGLNMYVVSGGIFSENFETLNNEGNVAIPDSCYKIVLITHHKELNPEIMIRDFKAIAVAMPNIQGIRRTPWREFATTISAIEKSTGYVFFGLLPDSISNVIKNFRYY